jgi:type II secretory pathway pseudopilin PulG
VKTVLLVLVLLGAAALLFAEGEPSGAAAATRQMSQLAVQQQVQEAVQTQERARLRLDPLAQQPASPQALEAPARRQARSGDGDGVPDQDRDRERIHDGAGDGPDQDRDRIGRP